jgi:hypothetical protein
MNTMMLWNITGWEFAALAAAATLVGFSKTAVSGANTVSLAIFAAVLPAKASTGVLLPILIVGDVLAVLTYRRHAHWPTLWRLFPAVAAGVVVGTVFLMWADDEIVRTSIGATPERATADRGDVQPADGLAERAEQVRLPVAPSPGDNAEPHRRGRQRGSRRARRTRGHGPP